MLQDHTHELPGISNLGPRKRFADKFIIIVQRILVTLLKWGRVVSKA